MPGIWIAPSVKDACTPRGGRGDSDARRLSPKCSKRAHAYAGGGDPSPRHDQFLGTRVGEASNPGPAPLGPWDPDPAFTSQFATFGEGCVIFVYHGLRDRGGSPTLSFRAAAPLGGTAAAFRVLREGHLFCGLTTGQAYVCAGARPVLPHWGGPTNSTSATPVPKRLLSEYAWPHQDLPGRRETQSGRVNLGHMPTWRVG